MPKKILIFGGSFDPPHKGHQALLSAALRHIKPDLALIVPAYQAPLKNTPAASAQDRLRLVEYGLLATLPRRWKKKASIDRGEIISRQRIYTYETLRRLKRQYPGADLHFIVGTDAAASFNLWKNPHELKASCRWWCANRPRLGQAAPRFFRKIPGTMPDISSTFIRSALALGQNARTWLTKPAADYIEAHALYGLSLFQELKKSLSSERFAHTLAVAGLAQGLAERWGANGEAARLSGLLHDWGRAIPIPRMPDYVRKHRLNVPSVSDIIRRQPLLLHAYISEDMARRRGLGNAAVLQAVQRHTLGGPRMTLLDQILYVADACSPDRTYPEAKSLRQLALKDIDAAFLGCVQTKISHTLSRGGWIHPLTISLWNNLAD